MDDERNKRIEEKIDAVVDKLHEIDKTLVRNTVSLEDHMRRTAANEENLRLLREEIKPLSTHVRTINWIAKVVTFIVTVITLIKFVF